MTNSAMLSLDFIQLETTAIIKKQQSAISLVVPELDLKNSSELMAKLEKSQTEGHKIAKNCMIWFLLGCQTQNQIEVGL
jgi:hypothetical protein